MKRGPCPAQLGRVVAYAVGEVGSGCPSCGCVPVAGVPGAVPSQALVGPATVLGWRGWSAAAPCCWGLAGSHCCPSLSQLPAQQVVQEIVGFLHRLATASKDCAVVMCHVGTREALSKALDKHSTAPSLASALLDLVIDCEKYASLHKKLTTSILAGCIQVGLGRPDCAGPLGLSSCPQQCGAAFCSLPAAALRWARGGGPGAPGKSLVLSCPVAGPGAD